MSNQYYLVNMGDNKQKIIRGDPDNWLSFAFFDKKTMDWDYSRSFSWAERILTSGFVDFQVIPESDAIRLIRKKNVIH